MLFTSRARKRVVQLPLEWLGLAGAVALFVSRVPALRPMPWAYWSSAALTGLALGMIRVATRAGDAIVVWGWFGRRRLPAADTFVTVMTRASFPGNGVTVELMRGGAVDPRAAHVVLARSVGSDMNRPERTARRAAEALELPAPWVARWIGLGDPALAPASPASSSRFLLIMLALAALSMVVGEVWEHVTAGSRAGLALRCRVPYQIKLSLGELTLMSSHDFALAPGDVTVEIWRPARACWAQRSLTLLAGTKTVLDLDELEALDRCDRTSPLPQSPDPRDTGRSRHR